MNKLRTLMLLASVVSPFGISSLYAAATLDELSQGASQSVVQASPSTARTHATVKRAMHSSGLAATLGVEPEEPASPSSLSSVTAVPLPDASETATSDKVIPALSDAPPSSAIVAAAIVASEPTEPALTVTHPQRPPFSLASLFCCHKSHQATSLEGRTPSVRQTRAALAAAPLMEEDLDPKSGEATVPVAASILEEDLTSKEGEHPSGYANVTDTVEGGEEAEDAPAPSTPIAINETALVDLAADTGTSATSAPPPKEEDTEISPAQTSPTSAAATGITVAPSKPSKANRSKGSNRSFWPWTRSTAATVEKKMEEVWIDVKPVIKTGLLLALDISGDLVFSPHTIQSFRDFAAAVDHAIYIHSNGATLQMKTPQGTRREIAAPSLVCAKYAAKNFTDEASVALSVILQQLAPCTDYSALITIVRIFAGYHNPDSSELLNFDDTSGKLSLKGGSDETLYLYDLVKKAPQQKVLQTIFGELVEALEERTKAENKLQVPISGNFLAPQAQTRTLYAELLEKQSPFVLNPSLSATTGIDAGTLAKLQETSDTTA